MLARSFLIVVSTLLLAACAGGPGAMIRGVVWQPDYQTREPAGDWDRLGAHELIIQWTEVDGRNLVAPQSGSSTALIDLARISQEPWAREAIVGLAAYQDETLARDKVAELAEASGTLADQVKKGGGLNITGWYFPVEIDPTWQDAPKLKCFLEHLPRPLWISAYDTANAGPNALVKLLKAALPQDVGILFQDGVGIYARTPAVAVVYLQALSAEFGSSRVRVIAEAFRPNGQGGFRSATPAELADQIRAYKNYNIYLFDGPHYVSSSNVDELVELLGTQKKPNKSKPLIY